MLRSIDEWASAYGEFLGAERLARCIALAIYSVEPTMLSDEGRARVEEIVTAVRRVRPQQSLGPASSGVLMLQQGAAALA
jgi:hypothetical protein